MPSTALTQPTTVVQSMPLETGKCFTSPRALRIGSASMPYSSFQQSAVWPSPTVNEGGY